MALSHLDSEGNPRTEILTLKPSTLPHGILDNGAGGERIEVVHLKPSPASSSAELSRVDSGIYPDRPMQSPWFDVFCVSMRIFFYLFVLLMTIGLTLAACKLTNLWDPCGYLYMNTTQCKVTSYLKGMVYHTECTDEFYCVLPGFERNVKRQGWSLHRPNDTSSSGTMQPQGIDETTNDAYMTVPE